jgi:hypothetical protein
MVRLLMIPYQNVGKVPRPKMLSLLVGKHALEKMRGASVPILASPVSLVQIAFAGFALVL